MRYFLLCIIAVNLSYSQYNLENLEEHFEDFAELPREQIFTHINKSTFITGESIWFKNYIVNRDNMSLSERATNLYCALYDENNQRVKSKLLLVNNGVAYNQFEIDSTFKSGEYTFKSFTNWTKNFPNELLHYESKIEIINPIDRITDKPKKSQSQIDLQLLPESGYLVHKVPSRIGIIANDSLGSAIENLKVKLFENDTEIAEIQLNKFGFGLKQFVPNKGKRYYAKYYLNYKEYIVPFPKIEVQGIVLEVTSKNEDIQVKIKTNTESLENIYNEVYKLTIHNSVDLKSYDFNLKSLNNQNFLFQKDQFFPGLNIITLFNKQGKIIAERLYFNYNNLNNVKVDTKEFKYLKDSILLQLRFNKKNINKSSLSASILPLKTKAYKHHNNILSSYYLSPFLKYPVNNLSYFFSKGDSFKQEELNELLIAIGWSRYDWKTIFYSKPNLTYDFEYGINYSLTTNSSQAENFIIYPNTFSKTELINIDSRKFFEKKGFFPIDDDILRIGRIKSNNEIGKSNVVLKFYPSDFPDISNQVRALPVDSWNLDVNKGDDINYINKNNGVEQLAEVKLFATKNYTRIEKLQNKTVGRIFDFDEKMKKKYKTFGQFIGSYGFNVLEGPEVTKNPLTGLEYISNFTIITRLKGTINGTRTPRIFINDVYLSDYDILYKYPVEHIDYVEINKGGIGEGLRGSAGVIRIYTDPQKGKKIRTKNLFSEYQIPIKFTSPLEYYSPIFSSTENIFFNSYGVIDWKPNLKIKNGILNISIKDFKRPTTIFLEGVVDSENFISEIILID